MKKIIFRQSVFSRPWTFPLLAPVNCGHFGGITDKYPLCVKFTLKIWRIPRMVLYLRKIYAIII